MKRMFVLKESKDSKKVWVFWSEHSRKWEIYFLFCVTEHLRHMVCSVLEINICSQDLQDNIYKTIKKTTYNPINKRYFKWDYNPFQKQPPEVFYKKAVLNFAIFSGKTPVLESVFKKETPTQVFSCEYCKTFENTNFEEHLKDVRS